MPELGSVGGIRLEWELVFGCNVTLWVVFTWIAVGFHGFGCHDRGCDESSECRLMSEVLEEEVVELVMCSGMVVFVCE